MRITLTNYRCYDSIELYLPDEGIHLLRGDSGVGKSTLLSSIAWIIYGGPASSAKLPTAKTIGILEISPSFIITRKKRPDTLTVSHSSSSYEGDEAKEFLESLFGSKTLWYTTSYIPQGERNSLLTGTNSDKMDILRKLAFGDDDPDEILLKISNETSKAATKSESLSSIHNTEVEKFNKKCDTLYNPPDETMKEIMDNIKELKERQKELNEKEKERCKFIGKQESLSSSLLSLNKRKERLEKEIHNPLTEKECEELDRLISLSSISEKEIEESKREKSKYDSLALSLSKRERPSILSLDSYSELSDNQLISLLNKTLVEIHKIESDRDRYNKEDEKALSLGIEYNQESIKNYIERIDELISAQPFLSYNRELQEKKSKYEEIESPEEEIIHVKLALSSAKDSLTLKLCPHCGKSVRLKGSNIIKSDTNPVSPQEIAELETSLSQLMLRKSKYDEMQKLKLSIEQLENSIDSSKLDEVELSKKQIQEYTSYKKKALSIVILPEPKSLNQSISEEEIERALSYLSIESDMSKCKWNEKLLNLNMKEIKREKEALIQKRKQYEEYSSSLSSLIKEIERVDNELQNITSEIPLSYKNEIDELLKDEEVEQKKKERRRVADEIEKEEEEILKKEKVVEEAIRKHELLEQLKTIAIKTQCETLENVILSLNVSVQDILIDLFEEPISIQLSLFKTTKTTNKTKQQVNLVIKYKGMETDTISSLSGGEADRVSLAITIALSKLSPSPFLFLDESLASLDGNRKEACIDSMRKHIPSSKLVLCVMHDGVEGMYDGVIHL
jgi:exonuclease SbcC